MTIVRHGGCLCGAVRYEADGEPLYQGLCCCRDCQRASGSAFVAFLGFPADRVRISGETLLSRTTASGGGEAVRNHCAACGSLVFGGIVGVDDSHTLYAGTLDDPAGFRPTMALFLRDKPDWAVLPESLRTYETMPGR